MADSDDASVAAAEGAPSSAQAKESQSIIPEPSSISSSASPPETTSTSFDPLVKALQTLFLNVTTLVRGELQGANSEYELLESMNLRVASEYDNQADFAEGLRVFVERLKQKNEGFSQYLQQIDEIDHEVTELEAVVSTLDNYTSNLESKIRIACGHHHGRQFT